MSDWKKKALAFEATVLCVIRKWWRPVTCLWMSGTMAVHGVVVPMVQLSQGKEINTDLTALSALVAAITAAFAVREWGKIKGNE